MLNDLGCELVTAAAARMRSSPFGKRESRTSDHMPGMDGYELAAAGQAVCNRACDVARQEQACP